jgi:Rod binding domain-containing protein
MDAPLLPPPSTYLDFRGLGSLKGEAHANRPEARTEAARQFETMFIQMMMKSMRAATPRGELLESSAMDTYQDLFDKEIANQMGRRGALGIASMLERQLARMPQPGDPAVVSEPTVAAAHPIQAAGSGLTMARQSETQTFLPGQRQPRSLVLPQPPGKAYPLNRTGSGPLAPDGPEQGHAP